MFSVLPFEDCPNNGPLLYWKIIVCFYCMKFDVRFNDELECQISKCATAFSFICSIASSHEKCYILKKSMHKKINLCLKVCL